MKNRNTNMLRTLIVLAVVFVVNAHKTEMNYAAGADRSGQQPPSSLELDIPDVGGSYFMDNPTIHLMLRWKHMATTRGDVKMSKCMKRNGMNSLRMFMMGITPKCDENGKFLPMQCYDHSEQCVCVRKDGTMINKPSTTIKGCQCLATKDEEENSDMIGGYIPQCEDNGTYKKKQCHYSTGYCFCADSNTGKNMTVPAREEVDCN